MIAVANASVLIGLSAIDRLALLQARFPDGIVIPDAVWREVVEAGGSRPGAHAVRVAPWIRRQTAGNLAWVRLLRTELDEGEAETIVLASEVGAGVVLLDERDARRLASGSGSGSLEQWGFWCGPDVSGRSHRFEWNWMP
jgi:hypothetical protein